MWPVGGLILVYCATAAHSAPLIEGSDELVLRLALHVRKTSNGAKLILQLEEAPKTPEAIIRQPSKPLLSMSTELPLWIRPRDSSIILSDQDLRPKEAILRNDPPYHQNTAAAQWPTAPSTPRTESDYQKPIHWSMSSSTSRIDSDYQEPIHWSMSSSTPRTDSDYQKPIHWSMSSSTPRTESDYKPIHWSMSSANTQRTDSEYKPINPVFVIRNVTRINSDFNPFFIRRINISAMDDSPKMQFKITVGSNSMNNMNMSRSQIIMTPTILTSTTDRTMTPTTLTTTERTMKPTANEAENETTLWDKAVADQGFGVLASRCASFGPGLVSDGAGGCTKAASRFRKKNPPTSLRFKADDVNELHSDVKEQNEDIVVVNLGQ